MCLVAAGCAPFSHFVFLLSSGCMLVFLFLQEGAGTQYTALEVEE